jgi:hypothetical protein
MSFHLSASSTMASNKSASIVDFVLEDPINPLNPNRSKHQDENGTRLRLEFGGPHVEHLWPPIKELIHGRRGNRGPS